MNTRHAEYRITDDKSQLKPEQVKALLDGTYWAPDRSLEVIATSIRHSICVSVLLEEQLVAFARIVTDQSLFAWIADVIVAPQHRGKGLGKAVMSFIQDHPRIPDSLQILRTKDAHGLYQQFGFTTDSEFMIK